MKSSRMDTAQSLVSPLQTVGSLGAVSVINLLKTAHVLPPTPDAGSQLTLKFVQCGRRCVKSNEEK